MSPIKKRTLLPARNSIPLEITDSGETGHCADEEEEIHAIYIQEETYTNAVLEKRQNAVTLAWV